MVHFGWVAMGMDFIGGEESGVRSQETGVRSQETGVRSQETGVRRQETGDRRQETGGRRQEAGDGAGAEGDYTAVYGKNDAGQIKTVVFKDNELNALDLWSLATEGTQEFHEFFLAMTLPSMTSKRASNSSRVRDQRL